ncbi:MAG: fluoride efflux transporter CrcB [Acidimicrobiales bacterium]|nr:fluoride efflux transporter CrcB [Acidimicrobiales bacterium]
MPGGASGNTAWPTALVAAAGALGAVTRYRLGLALGYRSFPWATLGINLTGSFLLAVVLAGPASRWSTAVAAAVAVGFIGAYTTFSTFSYETVALIRDDRLTAAVAYVVVSLAGGVTASALGWLVGRSLA